VVIGALLVPLVVLLGLDVLRQHIAFAGKVQGQLPALRHLGRTALAVHYDFTAVNSEFHLVVQQRNPEVRRVRDRNLPLCQNQGELVTPFVMDVKESRALVELNDG
jgi:hypothetical protein